MATIPDFRKNLKKLTQKTLEASAMGAVKKEQRPILDLNKDQLNHGVNSDGVLLGQYSTATEDIALRADPQPRKPKRAGTDYNFEWTGKFFDRMFLRVTQKEAVFGSKVSYIKLLQDKFQNLLGLSPAYQEEANQKLLKPWILKDIRKLLKL